MLRYHFTIPGKDLVIADMLSRAPTSVPSSSDHLFHQKNKCIHWVKSLPESDPQLERIKQELDEVCKQIKVYSQDSWPEKHQLAGAILLFYLVRSEITCESGLLEADSSFRHLCDCNSSTEFTQAILVSQSVARDPDNPSGGQGSPDRWRS